MIACLGKCSVRDPALRAGAGANRGEEAIERGLLRQIGHRQQRADQRRQRQLATAREGFGVVGVSSDIGKFV